MERGAPRNGPHAQFLEPGAAGMMSPQSSPPGVILVVDDNRDGADTTATLLETIGFTVVTAYSAREGLDRLDELPDVSLVISDIRMPDVDGFDFVRVVNHRFPDLPTLLTTGLPITDDDVVPRGALILQKPFAADALERAVAESLQSAIRP
jgi:CheY-like chemotaxis protein